MQEENMENHKFALSNLRESKSSAVKNANTLIKLTMKDLVDVCGGEGSDQGRRSTGRWLCPNIKRPL